MAKSYFSAVLDHSAEAIWAVVRDFGNYEWAGVVAETSIEEGKAGDAVGAVRNVRTAERTLRQRLLAHSDLERSYTYELCEPVPFLVRNYQATLRVTPVVADDRAFVEWWATFDCAPEERNRWTSTFRDDGFARWLGALQRYLAGIKAKSPAA
jgi:hypothetical protein